MLPSLSELTIGARTVKGMRRARAEEENRKRARSEPRFFHNLIVRPAEVYNAPSFELSSAVVVSKAGEPDVRIDFTVEYKGRPIRVRVKNADDNDKKGDCFYLKFEGYQQDYTQQAYLGSLLREQDPSECKIWKVNTTSMQSLGRTLVETTTNMMSDLNRGREARLNLIDASEFTARNAPLVEWSMQEYLCVKRGYSFYEALGYGDLDHDSAQVDMAKMNGCLRRNNLLFGTPLGKLQETLEREFPQPDTRGRAAVRNVEAAMTDEQKKKWEGLSLRGLLNEMEKTAKLYDPRRDGAPISGMQKIAVNQNTDYLRVTWKTQLENADAAGALEILAFLGSIKIHIGMPYSSNMFRKTLYPASDGGHTHILIKGDGTAYEHVRVKESNVRLAGLASEPTEAAKIVRDEIFPGMALLWLFLPER